MFLSSHQIKICCLSCLLFKLLTVNIFAHAVEIKQTNNIQKLSLLAKQKNIPILILFSIEDCPYCIRVKENFLIPMIISNDYKNKVIIRELNADISSHIIDISGNRQSSASFSRDMHIEIYPTMVFMDAKGCQLSKAIKGVNTPSMFGGRIDRAIEEANQKLNKENKICF